MKEVNLSCNDKWEINHFKENRQIWDGFLDTKQIEYIEYLFNKSNIEPLNENEFTIDIYEAFNEALERLDYANNEIVKQIKERGLYVKTSKEKQAPLSVPPSDLIEFVTFILSYYAYQKNISIERPEYNTGNYYDATVHKENIRNHIINWSDLNKAIKEIRNK